MEYENFALETFYDAKHKEKMLALHNTLENGEKHLKVCFSAIKKVVVIEEDTKLLDFYKSTLEDICKFYGFSKGKEALNFILNSSHINLIITGRCLPDISDDELCSLLCSNFEATQLPIIVISALSDIEEIADFMEQTGIKTYITKPVSAKTLRNHVLLLKK